MSDETAQIHVYDKETGKFMRSQEPKIDPLETKLQGKTVYVVYPNSTTKPVPEHGEHEVPYFIDGEWVVKGNWKNVKVYNTESKYFEYCYEEDLGENQVWIDDKEGIKKFEDEPMKWVVNSDLQIVENPNYSLQKQIQDIDMQISEAEQAYSEGLNEAVVYPVNGLKYKAKWIDDGTYAKLITGVQAGLITFPQNIWDATELEENMRSMTQDEFGQLCAFLALRQNALFETKKNTINTLKLQKAALEAQPMVEV